jgi:hypothetical protein
VDVAVFLDGFACCHTDTYLQRRADVSGIGELLDPQSCVERYGDHLIEGGFPGLGRHRLV